jgi:hypothetical protein
MWEVGRTVLRGRSNRDESLTPMFASNDAGAALQRQIMFSLRFEF